jgi:hypothetical protein
LGVSERAAPDEIRRAYVDLARRLHPDSLAGAGAEERDNGERMMREVNEAWRILGDPVRRLAYDAGRRRAAPVATAPDGTFSSGTLFGEPEPDLDLATRVLRALPWALIIAVLAGIFVFTAYATSDDGGRCVRLVGAVAESVDCGTTGAREVRAEVPSATNCPLASEPFQPAGRDTALCLAPLEDPG